MTAPGTGSCTTAGPAAAERVGARWLVGLVVVLVVLVLAVVAVVLGPGEVLTRSQRGWGTFAGGLVVLTGLGAGLLGLSATPTTGPGIGGSRREPILAAGRNRAAAVIAGARDLGLRVAGLAVVSTVAFTDVPRWDELGAATRVGLRAVLWAGVLVSTVLTALPRSTRSTRVRAAAIAVPFAVVLAVALVTAALGSPAVATQLVVAPLALLAGVALVLVPAQLILSATAELDVLHERGERLWRLGSRRRWLVLVLVGGNAVIAVVLTVLGGQGRLDPVGFSSSLFHWTVAVLVTGFLLVVLTLDSRIALVPADQTVLGRIITLVVAVPLGVLIAGAIVYQLLSSSLLSPLAVAVLVVAVVATAAGSRVLWRRRRAQIPRVTAAGLLGALASATAVLPGGRLEVPDLPFPSVPILALVFFAGLAVGLLVTTVILLVNRRFRILLLLGTIVWTCFGVFLGVSASDGHGILNLDLVLMAGLLVAALTWLGGRQDTIDGYEIALVVAVTTTLWLLPVALRLVPEPQQPWLLAFAFGAPGAVNVWTAIRARLRRSREERRDGSAASSPVESVPHDLVRGLAASCLSYALVAALAWWAGTRAAELGDSMAELILDLVLMPLSILLVLAASAARRAEEDRSRPPSSSPEVDLGPRNGGPPGSSGPPGPPTVWFPPPPPGSRPAGVPPQNGP